uniref:Uncharacterized protein n=1 Tax=Panagrolaimus sp. JU765 TaxID=591449 RepID=A0AC34PWA7_9BILA
MPKILFFLLVSSLFVQTFGVLLPVQGNVQLITNLHRFSPVLESVKSILGSNVQITNVLKFNNNACQFFKESYDLTIFVSDSNEICNVKTGKFSIQLVVHQDQVQFHYKTRSGSIKSSPKMKSESTIVENYMKIIFYDFLNDEFTKTGSLSHVETSFLKSITLDLRSWTYFLLGA